MLRQDPDIIMVGEIRDAETAKIAIEASLTGHLVLSTLHTNDAPSAVTRLVDMGVEPFLITSAVEAVLAQRLVRRICSHCKTEYEPEAQELRDMEQDESVRKDVTFYHGVGCDRCGFSKYQGRTGIFEIFTFNDELREMVLNQCSATELFIAAMRFGMVSLKQDGWRKICAGATTIEEVLRETF
jgi:type IV pilus assembly protein PilB